MEKRESERGKIEREGQRKTQPLVDECNAVRTECLQMISSANGATADGRGGERKRMRRGERRGGEAWRRREEERRRGRGGDEGRGEGRGEEDDGWERTG